MLSFSGVTFVLVLFRFHFFCFQQPIMPFEDRLLYRGWVRSAMVSRKCSNISIPKLFMAVRKFINCFVLLEVVSVV